MNTPTTPTDAMPPLPEADAWLIESPNDNTTYRSVFLHNAIGDFCANNPKATSTRLYSEAKLQAHAAQRCAALEARLAVADARVAELEFMVFKVGHTHQYTPATKQSAVKHNASNKVI